MKQHRPVPFEILDDPIIRQVMKADGVSHDDLTRLLRETAAKLRQAREAGR